MLSDTGVQLSGGFRLPWSIDERGSRINYGIYMINGPRIEPESESDHRFEELGEFLESEGAIAAADDLLDALGIEEHEGTEIEFGETIRDNKAIGARLGLLPVPNLELGGSRRRSRAYPWRLRAIRLPVERPSSWSVAASDATRSRDRGA